MFLSHTLARTPRRGGCRNIVATPRGQTVVNSGGGRRKARVQNPTRPGRVDSLANFQIYTLAVRSRAAGCFEKRGEGQLQGWMGHAWDPRLLTAHNARFSSTRVCAYQCLQELSLPPPSSSWGSFAAREQVESSISGIRRCEWDDFCQNRTLLRFSASIIMRMKAMGGGILGCCE